MLLTHLRTLRKRRPESAGGERPPCLQGRGWGREVRPKIEKTCGGDEFEKRQGVTRAGPPPAPLLPARPTARRCPPARGPVGWHNRRLGGRGRRAASAR